MTNKPGTYFPPGINQYVPAMQYSAALMHSGPAEFSLGTPTLGTGGTGIATAVPDTGVLLTDTAAVVTAPEPFGRTIRAIDSGDPGAALGIHDVYGFDYLGQPMIERITGTNGSTPVLAGVKAFKRVTKIRLITAATNAVTRNFGWGLRLGLPFHAMVDWLKENNVFVAVTLGTNWVLPTETDPATAITGEPRGTIVPAAAFDGVKEFIVGLTGDPQVNAAGNGGLHGIRHFYA